MLNQFPNGWSRHGPKAMKSGMGHEWNVATHVMKLFEWCAVERNACVAYNWNPERTFLDPLAAVQHQLSFFDWREFLNGRDRHLADACSTSSLVTST